MNQTLIEQLNAYIDAQKDNIVEDLMKVASIESVSLDGDAVAPFGQGCRNVMDYMLKRGEDDGFVPRNYEYYVGSLLYDMGKEDRIGILAHLDVVPAGDDWTVTEPFKPVLKDGFLFGRGVGDDKSGAIGGLYIMKAFREAGVKLNHNIDLLLGTNEETCMDDMEYYAKNYDIPKFTFVPDGGFPGCGGEFGRLRYLVTSNKALSEDFVDMHAGSAFNIVPNKAFVTLKKDTAIDYKSLPAEDFEVTETEEGVVIMAKGVTTHAARPENGVNAVKVLTSNLLKLSGIKEEDRKILQFVDDVNMDYYGGFFNIGCEDYAGKTVSSGTVLKFNEGKISLLNDCRRAVTDSNERLKKNITAKCEEAEFSFYVDEETNGYAHDVNGPVIQAIKKVYVDETGDEESQVAISKGGTYAGALPNAFATGVILRQGHTPDIELPVGHGSAHQPDEFVCVEEYIAGIKLLMKMVLTVDEIL